MYGIYESICIFLKYVFKVSVKVYMGQRSLCVVQVLYVSISTAYLLSCPFPLSPENGGVTVTDIHPGGQAHFHCDPGFQVRGHEVATCVNATIPRWSTPEPQCVGQYHDSRAMSM